MSRIIAIANQKGGVGKTTTSINLASALGSLKKRVLLLDLDPQGNATMGCGIDKNDADLTVFDLLVEGTPLGEIAQVSEANNCDILPANSDLTAAEVELMAMDEREQKLKQALIAAHGVYDYVLIDCPPSLNILTLNAFVAADSVLVPIQCEYYALEGLSALLETIEGVREAVNPDLAIEGLLRTMYDGRNNLGIEVSAQLIEHFGEQVFRTIVPRNVRLAEAPSHGVSIVGYDKTSRGALAYLALAGEIIRRQALQNDSHSSNQASADRVDAHPAEQQASASHQQESHPADPVRADSIQTEPQEAPAEANPQQAESHQADSPPADLAQTESHPGESQNEAQNNKAESVNG